MYEEYKKQVKVRAQVQRSKGDGAGDSKGEGTTPPATLPKPPAAITEKQDPAAQANDKPTPERRGQPQSKEMQQAMKLKRKYLDVSSRSHNLSTSIASEEKWAWANNSSNLGKLRASLDAVENKIKTNDLSEFLHNDPKQWRLLGHETMNTKLAAFLNLDSDVNTLQQCYTQLIKRHRAA